MTGMEHGSGMDALAESDGAAARENATRLGMLTPSSNSVLEPVCAAMLRGHSAISLHVSRFRVTEVALTAAALDQFALAPMLDASDLLADARVASICWNGTSATWLGLDRDRALCDAIERRTGVPATSSVLAMMEILKNLGLDRVGLVTPYRDDVQARIVETFAAERLSVAAERHSGLSENFAFANVSEADLIRMIEAVAAERPDAVLVLCTNLRAGQLVEPLERQTGLPILDSVGTALWGSMTRAGLNPRRIQGWGRMFQEA